MDIKKLPKEIIEGRRLKREEDLRFFATANLEELCQGADNIRKVLCGDAVNLCSIINGKSGKCSENCKFCAQSSHHHTGIEEYSFLDTNLIVEDCKKHANKGVHRYSIVTAGRELKGKDLQVACDAYKRMKEECDIDLCASHGLLSEEAFIALKESGVSMYHENIETSKRNFPNICTTHTYKDKINAIKLAQRLGFKVCSGGIIGMGETFEDRLDMAVSLAELKIQSIPINTLMPIKGTTYEDLEPLTEDEILRTVAMFRFINPTANIRLAAGRSLMEDSGRRAFHAGANATITGDLLTTSGNNIDKDKEMLTQMGFHL
ncbi:biotin synthase [Alkaliphilus metalliredigens QYMF]|uniref:Biotin synthase n=1 Tax=Alkaliphilus metalliredigens (strain QYMF) TaxID=293826 RepID=BIOB_ALKMQ|nr:biotin synthase BioB [Alkaliphilus metalliredigens]A6TT61.1 RecName: Full=Biotin synthase [Alkaliphilus metalliredigens QYMF]ABR49379.1 biotin synthase [Alkaliphilus metalliredigens QYMF]